MMILRPISLRTRRRRGSTLVESLISVAIFSTAAVFVAFVSLAMARTSRDAVHHFPKVEQANRSLSYIHKRLAPADSSSIVISEDGRELLFRNAVRHLNSAIAFDPEAGTCTYDDNVSVEDDEFIWGRDLQGRFVQQSPNQIRVEIEFESLDRANKPKTYTYSTLVTLRN